jgi:hypothetical protein
VDLEEVLFGLSTLATGSLDDKAERTQHIVSCFLRAFCFGYRHMLHKLQWCSRRWIWTTAVSSTRVRMLTSLLGLSSSGALTRVLFAPTEEVKKQSEKLFKAFCAFTKQAVNDIIYKKYHRTFPDYQLQPIMARRHHHHHRHQPC